jgi:transcriptional regulator with XRE-family HTH domain
MSYFDRDAFAEAVRKFLMSKQWSGSELSLRANIGQSQISRILGAKLKRFNLSHKRLCKFMHISPAKFMKDPSGRRSSLVEAVDKLCEKDPDREVAVERLLTEITRLAVLRGRHQKR